MAFLAVRFDAAGAAIERWADALLEAGALSVDVADPAAGTPTEQVLFAASDAPAPQPWAKSRLTVLFPSDVDLDRALAAAARTLQEPVPTYTVAVVADADWVRETRAQYQPIQIVPGLWIVPSWCEPVDPAAVNIRLDPGLAFGTGSHPTTRLCLRWLAEHLREGESVLDYGCGSGVLAIAAAKLGAGAVSGIDVDAAAIATSRANAEANDVEASFGLPDELPPTPADIVVANILASPLELLAPLFARRVSAGGRIVLSGILETQVEAVGAAYGRWFNIRVWGRECGWAALVGVPSAR